MSNRDWSCWRGRGSVRGGLPLGIGPAAACTPAEAILSLEDRIVLYTDGVGEALVEHGAVGDTIGRLLSRACEPVEDIGCVMDAVESLDVVDDDETVASIGRLEC